MTEVIPWFFAATAGITLVGVIAYVILTRQINRLRKTQKHSDYEVHIRVTVEQAKPSEQTELAD